MCQGKMPLSVRKRYEKMREQNNISLNIVIKLKITCPLRYNQNAR